MCCVVFITGRELNENRDEIKSILQSEEYGYIPKKPIDLAAEVLSEETNFCAGKATLYSIRLDADADGGRISFPIRLCLPSKKELHKIVVFINFRPDVPDRYLPAEEIIDRGWGFASLYYQDVTSDNGDFSDKAAGVLHNDTEDGCGKIAMWAWAAMRVMDYLQTRDDIDKKNIAVAGHSRLGKTALVVGAFDERFAFVHSNDSGAGGSALYSLIDENGEHIADLIKHFRFWFCKKYAGYIGKEKELPFDQHYLMSLIAPRVLSIGSAVNDLWATPPAERRSAEMASLAWESLGCKGLSHAELSEVDKMYHEGRVGYYVRSGNHYMSRQDWINMLDFFDKNLN